MILEDATFEAFGYYPSDLKPKSHKRIIAACELCGEFRILQRKQYHTFCHSCSRILGCTMNGKKNHNYNGGPKGRICLECQIPFFVTQSVIKLGHGKYCCKKCYGEAKRGEKNHQWCGGRKIAQGRKDAKRRGLGHELLMSLKPGEDEHHVTNEYVIGIPADVHNSIGGRRKKHRTLVLQWLKVNDKKRYKIVLCVLAKESLK